MMTLEGTQAADFSLEGSDGLRHTLSEYKGKTVVIFFYPKDNTSGCTKEACAFRDGYTRLTGTNTVLLGVSKDSITSHGRFISNHFLPCMRLYDPDTSMVAASRTYGEKV